MIRRRCIKILKNITTGLLLLLIIKASVDIFRLASVFHIDYDISPLENRSSKVGAFFVNRNKTDLDKSKWIMKMDYNLLEIPLIIVLCHKSNTLENKSDVGEDSVVRSKFFRQTKVLLKSIALVTKNLSRVIIVANSLIPVQDVKKFIDTWPLNFQRKLIVEYHTFTPRKECMDRKLFKLCASVRLFLHEILPHENSIIYVDSDFIFLASPEQLAHYFQKFKPSQFVGAAHNGGFYEFPNYFKNADYYYYGNTGVSSGLLLMNLTRIRNFTNGWTNTVFSVCRSYKGRLVLFDQGVYNIIFSEFTENIYELDCTWAFNLYYCHERSRCLGALKLGKIFGVHGPSNTFFLPMSKKLKILFNVFERFQLGDPILRLLSNLKFEFQKIERIQPNDTDGCQNFTDLDKALMHYLIEIEES